jgi:hypothetical protein
MSTSRSSTSTLPPPRPPIPLSHPYLCYVQTDNGGYYHYSTGTNTSATYEEVLPEVKAYHDSLGVPFKHWQFDSWFYPKDGGVGPGGGGGAVTNWTAMDSVFPSGMVSIQQKLGAGMLNGSMPMVMHNRQWSTQSDYIHNLTFEWYTSKYAVPKDPIAFFDYFFQQQKGWGLSMYEQDWCVLFDLLANLCLPGCWEAMDAKHTFLCVQRWCFSGVVACVCIPLLLRPHNNASTTSPAVVTPTTPLRNDNDDDDDHDDDDDDDDDDGMSTLHPPPPPPPPLAPLPPPLLPLAPLPGCAPSTTAWTLCSRTSPWATCGSTAWPRARRGTV